MSWLTFAEKAPTIEQVADMTRRKALNYGNYAGKMRIAAALVGERTGAKRKPYRKRTPLSHEDLKARMRAMKKRARKQAKKLKKLEKKQSKFHQETAARNIAEKEREDRRAAAEWEKRRAKAESECQQMAKEIQERRAFKGSASHSDIMQEMNGRRGSR